MSDQPERTIALTPVGWWLIVAPAEPIMVRNSVVMAEPAYKEARLGQVLGVGHKVPTKYPQLTRGQLVWYPASTGVEVIVNGHPVLFLKPDRVIGLVNSEG